MTVAELKLYLTDKKDDATIVVVAHNRDYEFTMSLGGGVDCEQWCDRSYDTVGFYVDELMSQNESAQPRESSDVVGHAALKFIYRSLPMYSIAETMDEIERGVDFGEFETLWQTLKVAVLAQQNNTQSKPCPACGGHTIMAPYCSVCQEAWDI